MWALPFAKTPADIPAAPGCRRDTRIRHKVFEPKCPVTPASRQDSGQYISAAPGFCRDLGTLRE